MFTSGSPAPSSRFTTTAGKEEGCGVRTPSASNIKKEIKAQLTSRRKARPTSSARFSILPGITHYNVFSSPVLASTVKPFLDAPASYEKFT